ncbi:calcium/sodium antiporter [Pseudomaricurvus alkylphenolicus]|jgi:cation:H+ antiporter|uniref:calcium/sodium antiporter n=1 Tax=Pseudomaricurvus alkylphenolicus TaxID=1306991 RepID=UPI00141E9526|nr:calcium/sodium antiporter [Pseudomaricurvus alkylphenolicus]NIB41864.1 calcium/sodium antiporter [Pseudomaricurvus alkylphenolicus]
MSELWLAWAAILGGFVGLIWSADRFVGGSAAIAKNLGVSRLVIGMTIVALGTSAPEIVVSISASLKGSGDLAVGNALGSNLANVGLVLAITALIAPMPIQRHLIVQEIPILLLVTAAAGAVLFDARISNLEGLFLLGALVPLLFYMTKNRVEHPEEEEEADIPNMGNLHATLWFMVGLCILVGSSELLVWGAQTVATAFGVSPLIIGLTVIAVGTSLPELAASVMSALKGHHEMALGNIIGSNIFNILAVMSLPGLINPPSMEAEVFMRDFAAMSGVTLLLAVAIIVDYRFRGQSHGSAPSARLGRRIGTLLLAGYVAYYYLLFN